MGLAPSGEEWEGNEGWGRVIVLIHVRESGSSDRSGGGGGLSQR